jgi:HlyD family secretion protein
MNGDRAVARVAAAKAERLAAEAGVTDAVAMARVAEADLGVAEAQVAVARAALEQAAATLSKCQVRAPFDGVVVLKDAEVGEVVSPQSFGGSSRGSVATMVDFASLEVQCKLPEKSLAAVVVKGPARVYLDAFPDRGYEGTVDRIWPTADRRESTVEVRVKLAAPDDKLRPEMGCRVVFLSDTKGEAPAAEAKQGPPAILVPETSVVTVGGKSVVFVVERGTAAAREVEVGPRRGASLPITAGLRPGDRVVVSPPPRLEDGDRVNVLEGS